MSNIICIATKKQGMTQVVHNDETIAVTLLEVIPHEFFSIKDNEKNGYSSICFSAGKEAKTKNVSKPLLKQFESKNIPPREKIFEVQFDAQTKNFSTEGDIISDELLESLIGSKVDAQGISIGKGFAGVMKRWNFRGLEATHGVSIAHRSHGSTGQNQDPGRVFKGKKMAGRLGGETSTVQNLDVVLFDKKLRLIGVKGAVPGHKNNIVFIKNAVKHTAINTVESINGLKIIYSQKDENA